MNKQISKRDDHPMVSILTITYNQEKFIEQTLESFLKQEVNFNYEIIVADDCSKDATRSVIEKYQKRYPNIIKPLLHKKNIGAINNSLSTLRAAKGKYIALCEGDDFWTDKTKLQRQVDFLENHLDYALCFHPIRVFFENGMHPDSTFPHKVDNFTQAELVKSNFIPTNSVMYRRLNNYDNLLDNMMPFDWYLHNIHAKNGKIGFINRVMAAYRRHEGGAWWASHNDSKKFWEGYGQSLLAVLSEFRNIYREQPLMSQPISDGELIVCEEMIKQGINPFEYISDSQVKSQLVQALVTQISDLRHEKADLFMKNDKLLEKLKKSRAEVRLLKSDLTFYMIELERTQQLYDSLRSIIKNPTRLLVRVVNRKKIDSSDKM